MDPTSNPPPFLPDAASPPASGGRVNEHANPQDAMTKSFAVPQLSFTPSQENKQLVLVPARRSSVGSRTQSWPPTPIAASKTAPAIPSGLRRARRPSDESEEAAPSSSLSPQGLKVRADDPWALPPMPLSRPTSSYSSPELKLEWPSLRPPRPTFRKFSSLDNVLAYRQERAEWRRSTSQVNLRALRELMADSDSPNDEKTVAEKTPPTTAATADPLLVKAPNASSGPLRPKFRSHTAEILFCLTIAMTQLLAEYLISGFAVESTKIAALQESKGSAGDGLTTFWPAALLSLSLSAALLFFARVSDMYGGYRVFLFGVSWLSLWTLIPGFFTSSAMLSVARAMQGIAIAAYTPSTFTLVGSFYPEGPRRNTILGLYGCCAPLGFYAGSLVAGALPRQHTSWYFWIPAIVALLTAFTAYLTVPSEAMDRSALNLKMDWLGAALITSGLVLLAYSLAVVPYQLKGFSSPVVIVTLTSGLTCLAVAVYVEGRVAQCPLLPFDFFRPSGVKAFTIASLFFYGSYGVWLYQSADWFIAVEGSRLDGITLALWYTPTAVGGVIFCIVGGTLLHRIPITLLLLGSGLAWIAAPLILVFCPVPLDYWKYVLPSALCATIGIDLTFTISTVFLSSSQPLCYQGLAGAVSSSLVNLAMSFSLSISSIIQNKAIDSYSSPNGILGLAASDPPAIARASRGAKSTFIFAAVSASVGFIICAMFVRIPREVVSTRRDEEAARPTTSYSSTTMETKAPQTIITQASSEKNLGL